MLDRRSIAFLIGLLAVMTIVPVLHSFYTTTDDVYFAVGIGVEGWRSPWVYDALRSGRLQHVVDGQLTPMAYGYGNYWLMKSLVVTAIASNVAMLFVLLRLIAGESRVAILAVVFFFAFIQNTWDHNLLTSYPFILHLALTLLLVALAMWWLALERSRPHAGLEAPSPHPAGGWRASRLRTCSLVLYGFSLFSYESFMIYGFLFPIMTFAVAAGTWPDRLKRALRTPHLPLLAAFVVAVVLFRVLFMTPEGRANADAEQYAINLAPGAILRVLERYTFSALPMHYFKVYRDLINDFYLGYGTFRTRFFDIFRVFEMAWLAKAAIVGFLVGSVSASRTVVRRRGLLLIVALVFMVLSSLPLAVTGKYQEWVLRYFSHAYLTSYFAFVGVVMLFAVVLDALVGAAAKAGPRWGRAAAGALAVTAFFVSYGTDFVNAHVGASQRQTFDRWATVDAWMASPAFTELPDLSVVIAPSLWERYPGATFVYDEYWTRYVSPCFITTPACTPPPGAKRISVVNVVADDSTPWGVPTAKLVQEAEAAGRLYYLKLVRDARNDLSYLSVGKIASYGGGEAYGARELSLITHARAEHLRVVGRLHSVTDGCRARVLVDGRPSRGTFDGLFGVHVDRRRPPEEWLFTRLSASDGLIDPETLLVAESTETIDGAVDVRFGSGFYPDEVTQRWAADTATMTLVNRTDRAVEADLQFEIRAPWAPPNSSHRLTVTRGGMPYDWPIGERPQRRSLPVSLAARATVDVRFTTTAPRIDPGVDGRNLVLMFLPDIRVMERGCGG